MEEIISSAKFYGIYGIILAECPVRTYNHRKYSAALKSIVNEDLTFIVGTLPQAFK